MYDFSYHRPTSVTEAVALLKKGDEVRPLSGGMTLLPTLKQRLAQPSDLVDLSRIPELQGIAEVAGGLRIGAFTRHADVAGSAVVGRVIPALATLAGGIGDRQVRNRGTLGGSVSNADPSADYPAAVIGLKATVHTDQRDIPGEQFFLGMFETALAAGELLTAITFTAPDRAGYAKFANPASRYATVGVMVARYGNEVRVGVTGAGPSAFRAVELEQALGADFRAEAVDGVHISADELNTDMHASADYRAHLVKVMARRAVAAALG